MELLQKNLWGLDDLPALRDELQRRLATNSIHLMSIRVEELQDGGRPFTKRITFTRRSLEQTAAWLGRSHPSRTICVTHEPKDAQLVATDESETAGKKSALKEVFSNLRSDSYTQTIYAGESASKLRRVLTITGTRKTTPAPMQSDVFKLKSLGAQTQSLTMPGPAVQNYMLGTWLLALKYEPSPDLPNGATGQGTEVWWAGPGGYSVIEEYYQNDANEPVEEFSPAWWDEQAGGQRFLYCSNTVLEGCYFSKGVFRWEDDNLVFREERERRGKTITYSLIFRDITPKSFTQVNAESDSGNLAKPTLTIRASKVSAKLR